MKQSMASGFDATQLSAARRLACACCGAEFACDLSGRCWCADEAFVLPVPADGSDCLCPDCLREKAASSRGHCRT